MIRYNITLSDLQQRINAKDENWFQQANLRTQAFQQEGEYNENLRIPDGKGGTRGASPIWSKIKSVYMALQHEKCAYCERQLASEEFGKIEHDLEHYRPKKTSQKLDCPGATSIAQQLYYTSSKRQGRPRLSPTGLSPIELLLGL